MATPTHTRRALFGAMAIAPIVVAAPALVQATGPSAFRLAFDANLAAEKRYNSLSEQLTDAEDEAEYARMALAYDRMISAQPSTWPEFVEKYEYLANAGYDMSPRDVRRQMSEVRLLMA